MADELDTVLSGDQIRTMIAIAEQGTFNKAAMSLGVSQSSVNQQVGRIEARVGRRLFERTKAGVKLNNDGEAVLVYSRAMTKLGAGLRRQLASTAPGMNLRVGLSEDFARTAFPEVLGLFARRFPSLRFQAVSSTKPQELFELLDRRELDVVMSQRIHGESRGEVFWTGATAWMGSLGLALPVEDPVPLVIGPAGSALRAMMLEALQGAGRSWRIVFESAGVGTLEAALRVGLGVAACPVDMNLKDIVYLEAAAGLPAVAPSVFVHERIEPAPSEIVEAFCEALRTAARLSFAPGADEQD